MLILKLIKLKFLEKKLRASVFAFLLNNDINKEADLKLNKACAILRDRRNLKANIFFETWKSIFSKDKKTYGYIHFNFCKMNELKDIRGMYIEFSGHF